MSFSTFKCESNEKARQKLVKNFHQSSVNEFIYDIVNLCRLLILLFTLTKRKKRSSIDLHIMRIIFFTEPSRDKWRTPLKMGNLYMNRFAIDEDAAVEVLKIFELKELSQKNNENERKEIGN